MNHSYEILKFSNNKVEINSEYSDDPNDIWLTLDQTAFLFNTNARNILNITDDIFKSKEMEKEKSLVKKYFSSGEKSCFLYFLNLKLILSIGYKIKSDKGLIFKKWVNDLLHQYLTKGFITDENRLLISKENFDNLIFQIDKINNLKNNNTNLKENYRALIFNGSFFNADDFVKKLFNSAKKEIIIFDKFKEDLFAKNVQGVDINKVKIKLFTSSTKSSEIINSRFKIIKVDYFYNEFIIIDKTNCYQISTVTNSNKKLFIACKIDDDFIIKSIYHLADN